jgi:hypothetical protein
MSDKITAALTEYVHRNFGGTKPKGEMVMVGSKGRFVLDESEILDCCKSVTPYMRFSHAFSVKHIATLYGISTNSLNVAIREWKKHNKAED